MSSVLDRIKQEGKTLKTEFRLRTVGFILGGLGVIAALAWNDAVKALIEYFLPLERDSLLAKFVYAIVISVVVVVFSVYLTRLIANSADLNDKAK